MPAAAAHARATRASGTCAKSPQMMQRDVQALGTQQFGLDMHTGPQPSGHLSDARSGVRIGLLCKEEAMLRLGRFESW
jgi:hypothetical protein